MSEYKPEDLASIVLKVLPILPALGFIFAMAFEIAFFWTLGISPSQILDIADIVRTSVFYVIPAIPLLFIGFWSGTTPHMPGGESLKSKFKAFYFNAPAKIVYATVLFAALTFLLLGTVPEFGSVALLIVIAYYVFRVLINDFSNEGFDERFVKMAYLIGISSVIFAGIGMQAGYAIRSADENSFPTTDGGYFVRAFSSGHLLLNEDFESLTFEAASPSRIVIFEVDRQPFQGLLCHIADWCWANGWQASRAN